MNYLLKDVDDCDRVLGVTEQGSELYSGGRIRDCVRIDEEASFLELNPGKVVTGAVECDNAV